MTFDQNGNLTGQETIAQSWRGNTYDIRSWVEQLADSVVRGAMQLWAQAAGNPSRNSTAARDWYFILNWQNQFNFIPNVPTTLPNLTTDITSQAATIKAAALQALKQAYSQWPVIVVEGTPGTGDKQALVQQIASNGTDCGNTDNNQSVKSLVFYDCNMKQAQLALQVTINNAQDEANALQNKKLIQAIGRGIGNNAAHEFAHLFLALCCSMDAKTSADANAAATYNNGDADGDPSLQITDSDPAPYTGYGKDGKTAIHWENTTQQALQKCLGKGVKKFKTSCVVDLSLARNRNTDPRQDVWAKALARSEHLLDNGDPLSLPWTISGNSAPASTLSQTLAPHARLVVQSSALATDPLNGGSARLVTNGSVSGFIRFKYGPRNQEAIVPIAAKNAASYILPFDNTNGLVAGMAVANGVGAPVNIPLVIRDNAGVRIGLGIVTLVGNGHRAFVLSDQFPIRANKSGTVEFGTPGAGQISVLGFRFPTSGAFSTIPVIAP